jgi:spore coat polysaccharide biosynthesis protein SpsF (cytidylyltransferase family)
MEQVSHPIFLSVLEYLYTDNVDIPLSSAMELFEAADLFCIPRLKTMCEKRMLQSITIENAASIFHAADLHSAAALRRKAMKYILSHFEDVSKTESFEEMGRGNMELVFEILRNR